ncbi:proteasome regulatory particle lid subunit RPN12 KNAG_0D03020 [Huiozyma naganishii CBS 8797]|uniref:PCI domain-containing protein n=1 Tax=Huiozyma naganishii (strain ATCC MYA-139 / BCRC 22969 / CBS 8797 / KCTC 17520 / NBRC 10181 / NCYC 3082 / Yp74L-3) TaxID=1071383 RepID=J7S717_HUIN7|nr:hypothetical protein KNAG_0D03020 [Kazachstania naganishii CBS 8797]CCK70051.1 hypothetical protein KNAG_0D03020 [Kazachstania naganishii CBS 8797]
MSNSLGEQVKKLIAHSEAKDWEQCSQLASAVEIELLKTGILFPDKQRALAEQQYMVDLNTTKKILEIGALAAINVSEFQKFKDYYKKLSLWYFNDTVDTWAKSDKRAKIVCLYLLILLSEGEVTTFHSELEFLDKHLGSLEDDEFLSYPVKVDRWLMEGAYQNAWDLLESGLQIPEFDLLSQSLMDAIRDEIARNIELTYDHLPLSSLKALLFFDSEKVAEKYAGTRGWTVQDSVVHFPSRQQDAEGPEDAGTGTDNEYKLILRSLNYAKELETIV